MQKKYSVRKFEEILGANKASGLNLSHMDDLYSQYVTTRNIGYVPKELNTITLDSYDKAFRDLYKKRNNLFKNKTPGWENKVAKINKDGVKLAKASEGYKQFTVKKPDGKTKVVGVDLQKMKCEVYTPPAAYTYIQSLKNINDELGGCYVLTGAGLMGGAIMKKRLINYPTNHLEFADRGLALEYLKSWRNREELADPAKNCFYALLKIMDEIPDKNVTV